MYKKSEGIVVNRDDDSLQQYRMRREKMRAKENQINTLEEKVNALSQDMEEIKSLLRNLAK